MAVDGIGMLAGKIGQQLVLGWENEGQHGAATPRRDEGRFTSISMGSTQWVTIISRDSASVQSKVRDGLAYARVRQLIAEKRGRLLGNQTVGAGEGRRAGPAFLSVIDDQLAKAAQHRAVAPCLPYVGRPSRSAVGSSADLVSREDALRAGCAPRLRVFNCRIISPAERLPPQPDGREAGASGVGAAGRREAQRPRCAPAMSSGNGQFSILAFSIRCSIVEHQTLAFSELWVFRRCSVGSGATGPQPRKLLAICSPIQMCDFHGVLA